MITPSFALTATERVLPKLALDFTTASLDSRITFTRATGASNPATYINSSGVVTAATNNQPRFDYDPVTLDCKGLLIEESRTNLLLKSEAFGDADWFKGTSASVIADAEISPDGTQSADQLVSVGTTASSNQIRQSYLVDPQGLTFTFSVWLKAGGVGTNTTIRLSNNSDADGAQSTVTLTDQWQRFSVTRLFSNTSTSVRVYINYLTQARTIYVWGAQLEAGAFATSYIPTTSAALTRNADVVTMTGTNFSDWFEPTQGTFAMKYIPVTVAASPVARILQLDDGSTTNRTYFTSTTTGQLALNSAGVLQAAVQAGSITVNQPNTITGYFNTDAFNCATNATLGTKDTSGTPPSGLTILRFFKDTGTTNVMSGHVQKLAFWKQAVTDSELQAFSK